MELKEEYNQDFISNLASDLLDKEPSFPKERFVKNVLDKNWKQRSLKERMHQIVVQLHDHLSFSYAHQIKLLRSIAPSYSGIQGFVFPHFVQLYGMDHYSISINALKHFTQFSTAEFAIRPFIETHPEKTIHQLVEWSRHENHHVRRLASEGTRPRLPWASPLRSFIKDPTPILPILENLKNDGSEYVRKSVANHLNDISKDHPKLALSLAKNWYGRAKNTNWIVKHALRTLLKQGNKEALQIFGLDNAKNINVEELALEKNSIKIGDTTHFKFIVHNLSDQTRDLRLEYKIDYVKANSSTSSKVFHISEFTLKPGAKRAFNKKQHFKDLSTRKHYPGDHCITVIVNGEEKQKVVVTLS